MDAPDTADLAAASHHPEPKRACDQCRFRKTRCSLSQPCTRCQSMGFDCTFLNPQRKRGPPGKRVAQIKRLRSLSNPIPVTGPDVTHSDKPLQSPLSEHTSFHSEIPSSLPAVTAGSSEWASSSSGGTQQPNTAIAHPNLLSEVVNQDGTPGSRSEDSEYWLPNVLGGRKPSFGFSWRDVYVQSTLQPIAPPAFVEAGLNLHATAPGVSEQQQSPLRKVAEDESSSFWPAYISETSLFPWIDVYFDRLHATLPVLNRSALFTRLFTHEHRDNRSFAAMLLSLCAFALTQPIEIAERRTASTRATQAQIMMNEAIKMRSSSDFGEHPTIEAVLTSFFLFGGLFGSNQQNAARLRLREASDLAQTMRLDDPASYADLPVEERGQRLRTYLVLSITERAYALQRRLPIQFIGKPGLHLHFDDIVHSTTRSLEPGIVVHNEKDAAGMLGLALLIGLFDAIDEDIVQCWNGRCSATANFPETAPAGACQRLNDRTAVTIHTNLQQCLSDVRRYRSHDWFDLNPDPQQPIQRSLKADLDSLLMETQCADVLITQKWLQNRVWHLCLTHGLLESPLLLDRPEFSISYVTTLALDTLDLCQSLRISSMEVHGIGLIEKLYDIASTAIIALCNRDILHGSTEASPTRAGNSQFIADAFLKLFQTLRGGSHPYLNKFEGDIRVFRAV